MKTGVNTGIIINVKNSPIIKKATKKSKDRQNRASVCTDCPDKVDGFCRKFKKWPGKVNYKCLGIKDPYERKGKNTTSSKKGKKTNRKAEKKAATLSASQIEKLAKRYRIKL